MSSPQRFSLTRGLLCSLALHALLATPFWLHRYWLPIPPPQERLVIELAGLISNRQTEASRQGEQAPPTPASPAQPTHATQRHEVQKAQRAAASPVKLAEKARETPPESASAPPTAPGAQDQQVRQTIQGDRELDAIRRYSTAVRKAIEAKQAYPAAAGGKTGVAVVAFRLRADGQIEPGSLAIRTSSGSSVLDAQALNATRAAAPFAPPPHAMPVVIALPFFEKGK